MIWLVVLFFQKIVFSESNLGVASLGRSYSRVEEGKVYTFCKSRVREWNKNLTLSLLKESKVQLVDEASMNFDPEACHFALGQNCIDVLSSIYIENITEFMQCINCNKKIVQDSGRLVVFFVINVDIV